MQGVPFISSKHILADPEHQVSMSFTSGQSMEFRRWTVTGLFMLYGRLYTQSHERNMLVCTV